jgi:hypothetical protein
MLDLKRCAPDQCFPSINDSALACIYEISIGNVKKIRCIARRSEYAGTDQFGRRPVSTDDQEAPIARALHRRASEGIFIKKVKF